MLRGFGWLVASLVTLLAGAIAVAAQDDGSLGLQSEESLEVAHALLAAFNAHDPDAMARLVSEDFELFYVSEAGLSVPGAIGREQLRSDMRSYFEARPAVRSEAVASIPGAHYVAFREQIEGGASSLAVYEIRDHLVRRAWYYPEEPPR